MKGLPPMSLRFSQRVDTTLSGNPQRKMKDCESIDQKRAEPELM